MSEPLVRRARWSELDPQTLHDLVKLRVDVFVVEQSCPYPELDGRDPLPSTEHVWVDDAAAADDKPAAYLRVLAEPDGDVRVGRVCTRAGARGRGLAKVLMDDVLTRYADRPVVLDAQAYLAAFYAGLGFVACGPQFLDDGIPHVPMRRDPSAATAARPRSRSTAPGGR